MNQVVLVGRLCSQPEVKTTEDGRHRSTITVAINRPFKNMEGVYETDFVRCVLWNNAALNTFEHCQKGDVVGIKGRLQTRNYENEEKTKNFIMEVIAEKITFLSNSKDKTVDEEKTKDIEIN